jgi:molybdate transport system permease protein
MNPENKYHLRNLISRHSLALVSMGMLCVFVTLIILLVASDVFYLAVHNVGMRRILKIIATPAVRSAIVLSMVTSTITIVLVMVTAIPAGYALSRYRFPGHTIINTLVDAPIVLPPVVIGISLLAFFGTPAGAGIKHLLHTGGWTLISGIGIVLCQYLISISYCIRAAKASFDSVNREVEQVALTLGCTRWGAFKRISLPLARNGLIAGGIMAWARAIGVFGPLMVFVGTSPRVQVMPTTLWLELSVGNIETALVIALISLCMAGGALIVVHLLAPGKPWT